MSQELGRRGEGWGRQGAAGEILKISKATDCRRPGTPYLTPVHPLPKDVEKVFNIVDVASESIFILFSSCTCRRSPSWQVALAVATWFVESRVRLTGRSTPNGGQHVHIISATKQQLFPTAHVVLLRHRPHHPIARF